MTRIPQPFRPHPWHGLPTGPQPPDLLNVFIEMTPFDLVKFEVDKQSGYLMVDRPQRGSSQPPALYGFVPRTYCGPAVCALSAGAERGDGDPLDACVLSERPINRGEVIVRARVIGGLQMVDAGEADDKLITVLESDHAFGEARDVGDVPPIFVERLEHYFTTYKARRGQPAVARVASIYGREHALAVVAAAIADYTATFT